MFNKKIDAFSLMIQGLAWLFLGMILLSRWQILWTAIYILFPLVFLLIAIVSLMNMTVRKRVCRQEMGQFIVSVFIIIYCVREVSSYVEFIPYILGWWTLFLSVLHAINYFVYRRDNLPGTLWRFTLMLMHFIVAVYLLMTPLRMLRPLSMYLGVYLILYGGVQVSGSIKEFYYLQFRKKSKNRRQVAIPVLLSALIPYRLYASLDKLIKSSVVKIEVPKKMESDLEIYIYLSSNGPEAFGHIDIAIDDTIYSYGCHDPQARKLFGMYGDGVLIESERLSFLKHALEVEHKTIIVYGVKLTPNQKSIVLDRIQALKLRSNEWQCAYARNPQSVTFMDYASRVYKGTNAKMYKFSKGKFRTYFVLSTNCVLLAEHCFRSSELDLLVFSGLSTPGNFLSFLNVEYARKDSSVFQRFILKNKENDVYIDKK